MTMPCFAWLCRIRSNLLQSLRDVTPLAAFSDLVLHVAPYLHKNQLFKPLSLEFEKKEDQNPRLSSLGTVDRAQSYSVLSIFTGSLK